MQFSLIIPVYNRPDEVRELLESLANVHFQGSFEVVLVEDGSTIDCRSVAAEFEDRLHISYYFKQNSGPGDSRNFGMRHAKGDYFLIFDSDCIIPPQYLTEVASELERSFTDCFGGPDAAHQSFTDVQKAINFSMTSIMTTGGIRGGSEKATKFQPRSFNMGLSKAAFEVSGGFGNIHPGEDPDLSIRLWQAGFTTRLFPKAFVYHKRRINWNKFYIQVNKFGKARPILDSWHPDYRSVTFYFPSIFMAGLIGSLILMFAGIHFFVFLYLFYFAAIFLSSTVSNSSIRIGFLSLIAVAIQFFGYGYGFARSFYHVRILKRNPQMVFPELFFSVRS